MNPGPDESCDKIGLAVSGIRRTKIAKATAAAVPAARKAALYPKRSTIMPAASPLDEAPIP